MDELLKQVAGEPSHVKTIKENVSKKYGVRIIFSTFPFPMGLFNESGMRKEKK